MFLPPHKYKVAFFKSRIRKIVTIEVLLVVCKSGKAALKIYIQINNNRTYNWKSKITQCFLSTSSSASHFRVRKLYFFEIISASKKVVNSGNSDVSPVIFKNPQRYEFSSSTCWKWHTKFNKLNCSCLETSDGITEICEKFGCSSSKRFVWL